MKHYSLFIILILGLVLRLINLNQSLWWDEAINVVYAKSNNFWWFVTEYPLGDFHPPGWFALLWIWGNTFGFSEISVRLPSVILGVATVWLAYLLGKKLFNKKVGITAALFLTVAPLHIYYSQEARLYSFAAFSATLLSYFLIKLIKDDKFAFFGYVFSVFLVLYADYLTYLILPAHVIFVFIYKKKLLKKYFSALFIGTVSIIPWTFVFPEQLKMGIEKANQISGWREVVGGLNIKELMLLPIKILIGRITFNNKLFYATLVSLTAVPYLFSIRKIKINNWQVKFLLFCILFPLISAVIFSFFIPVFSYFRLLFVLPAFYLIVAYGIDKYTKFEYRALLILLIVFFQAITSIIYLFNTDFHREDWKGAVDFVNKNSDVKTVTLHKSNEIPAPFKYYKLESVNSFAAFNKISAISNNDLTHLKKNLLPFNRIFLFDYLVDITDPSRFLEKELGELEFKKIKTFDFRGVGFIYLYVR